MRGEGGWHGRPARATGECGGRRAAGAHDRPPAAGRRGCAGGRRRRRGRAAARWDGRRADPLAGAQTHGRACGRAHGRLGQRVGMEDARANAQGADARPRARAHGAMGWLGVTWDSAHQLRLCDVWSRKAAGPGRRRRKHRRTRTPLRRYRRGGVCRGPGDDNEEGPAPRPCRRRRRGKVIRKLNKEG